jgi:transcriptional regulator with XRE-family HTH domain
MSQKILEQFGNSVRETRLKKGLTQEKLAYKADLSANYLGRIERGQVNPTLETIEQIANALGCSISELVD